jgi:NAD(P)-dependent dehydrogenase (short-subunit alcohol dehydrogenase family)
MYKSIASNSPVTRERDEANKLELPLEKAGTMTETLSDNRFLNKVVVITGAGGSFGRDGCLFFAKRGAKIAALDLNASSLAETVAMLNEDCPDADIIALEADVTSVESIRTVMEQIVEKFGSIDMLWNNAGYQGEIKPTLDYDPADFARVMEINVTGMFIVLQAAGRQMAKQDSGGSIVNTASVAGLRGTPAMVAYVSSKAAVLGMTGELLFVRACVCVCVFATNLQPQANSSYIVSTSKDLAPYNIRVNAVSPALIGPGYMWTRQNEMHAASGSPYFATNPEIVATGKINSVPMKRLGTVCEVIKSVAFLLSDDASYTTGVNLVIDGGMSGGLKA